MRNDINNQFFDLITIRPADPAVAANFSYNLPDGQRLKIIGVQFNLATDANAANRFVRITGADPTGSFIVCSTNKEQTASTTRLYNFSVGAMPAADVASLPFIQGALCDDLFLRDDETLDSDIISLQAGDQISNIVIRARKYDSQWVETTQ